MDISEDTRGNFIRVVIDAERPVTLDDTTNLSKKLRNDRKLKITFSNGDGIQTITGTLIDANNTCVYLKESGQEFSLRYDQINSAKVLISFN